MSATQNTPEHTMITNSNTNHAVAVVTDWMLDTEHHPAEWALELDSVARLHDAGRLTADALQAAVCLFDIGVAGTLIARIDA